MPKPKAPRWLTESFRDGVDERATPIRPHPGQDSTGFCWLAQHDPRRRPCSGPLERAHLIPRQRVENALAALLPWPDAAGYILCGTCKGYSHIADACPDCDGEGLVRFEPDDLILLAAWDPRNGIIACEAHHRRFDSHATPALIMPGRALPSHAVEFAADWGLVAELRRRCP